LDEYCLGTVFLRGAKAQKAYVVYFAFLRFRGQALLPSGDVDPNPIEEILEKFWVA
jgi:hypothetical protein